jgi:hypothetical protein
MGILSSTLNEEYSLSMLPIADLMAPYDDIAVEVVSSDTSNMDVSLAFTNRELVEHVCRALNVEDFDLFEEHAFELVYEEHLARGDDARAETPLAYAFIAFLRWRVFTIAMDRGVGIPTFSEKAASHSEMWYIRLVDLWNESNKDSPQIKTWMN